MVVNTPRGCRATLQWLMMYFLTTTKRTGRLRSAPATMTLYLAVLLCLLLAGTLARAAQPQAQAYFWHPELAPAGPLVLVVSLDEQRAYVYRNGIAIGESRISSGRPGYETPAGVYTILQKAREHRSNLYDDAPMPFMQRLTWDGLALHAGTLPGHPASHGCIRLPAGFAERLFAATARGTVVVVTNGHVAPAIVNHPAAIAPVDLAGRAVEEGAATAEWPPDDGGPLSLVASIRDRVLYVMQSGRLIARATLTVPADFALHGTLLYVRRGARADENVPAEPGALWSVYRILGEGPAIEPRALASQLKVGDGFGDRLRERLRVGTTVLVTDLPGQGGQPEPYGVLLEGQMTADPPRRK